MSTLRASGSMSSASSSSLSADISPSNVLFFKGLPAGADTAYILSFLNGTHIAKGKDGQPLISFFPVKDVQKYRNCKVTFTSIVRAGMYLNQWNNKCPPQSTNKLAIRYWVERPNNGQVPPVTKHDKKPKPNNIRPAPLPTKSSNCIIIHGLPENITVTHICAFVGGNVARGNSNQPLIRILPVKNGYRSARVILISIAEARQLINNKHGKPLPGYSHNLTINYHVDRGNGRKYDADTTKKVRQAAVAGTKSVLIKGLLENCNEQYLISLIGQEKIATSHKGRLLVTMFPGYSSAKVTFKSVSDARKFISNYHNTPLAANRKLTVQFYLEREEQKPLSKPIVTGERHTDKAKTIVRNVVYIQGINRKYTEEKLTGILEGMTGGKIVKTKIYRYENGTSQGRGLVIYRDAEEAEICVDNLNGVKLDHNDVALKVGLFESTKFRRLREAIGNAHLFTPNSKGFAYGCVGCFEYWDERDMLGCVPLDRQEDPESHFMCQTCVRGYCEGKKAGGRLGNFGTGLPCGQDDCRRILLWASVNRVLTNSETATQLDKRMTHEALRDFEEIEHCKEENCDFGAILPDPLLQQFFACQNPSCMAQFCRICKVSFEHHIERSCDQVDPRRQVRLDRLRLVDVYGF